ncbi:unnamed protein product [Tilletia controversa]|uniref:Protein lifeguard 4 n=3 Tax=Tilletia TaxID=13289 RepID=A0A8X7MJH7_9BASI|nr:hypothetical protein CF328_g8049 [Tilletia controversa]KAE8183904.1 hypothetical protein CF335_g8182 [Tilletia laevis]KAE8254328.1 hypothetical protein A4X03_0g5734 [Tilletia caries]KAE8187924.1 hypothetical protein CF336_g6368 [Tilletia laevis]KAE8238133.1 hypothetical protein A4X06_0g8979 [Tilletia controversa]
MSYAQQPPAYGAAAPTPTSSKGAYQPLPQHDILAQASASASAQSASAHQQLFHSDTPRGEADEDDPDDFKYGTTVSQCSLDVRHAFLRKVYTTLFLQLLGTTVVGALLSRPAVADWLHENSWAMISPLFLSMVAMIGVYALRHKHPWNLVLLATFTLLEALSLGAVVSYVDQVVVLQAMIITCFAFVGLTLITLQSRWDFESMGSWLFGGLLILVGAGFVQIFLPFSRTLDLVMAGAGTVLFSLYIVYDTSVILKRLSPEDWVLANLSLYLDIINLFINILRILNGVRDD